MQTNISSSKVSLDKKTILVLEDDPHLSRIIIHKLNERGHNPLLAANVDDAIKIMEGTTAVDILWLDILLPGASGLDFLKYVKEREQFKDIKAFIVSASGGVEQQEEAQRLGVVEYVVKGEHSLDEIIERIVAD